ncbi:MAG: nickel-dependent hydrogenase large subunit [Selenomonadaceae bacterium]|nr:nickel-dependent hydrogenase large subunit [Selenomonadaceae bacterium]
MAHVVVDPITRIEGHLRVEVEVNEKGQVTDAISSGTAWRGLELIMKGRDPRDAWAYIQRICGVCTTAHALASVRAVEDALGIAIPKNANYIRNIMAATLTVQDHLVHFYHLHALDWISPVEALAANPTKTAELQTALIQNYRLNLRVPNEVTTEAYPHDFPAATAQYFAAIQAKVKGIVDSGQLGIFAANWWDHPDYKILPAEVHLLAVAHYLEMLDKQREIVTPHVIFGGKNPHPHYVVGGMPCAISLTDGNAPVNTARLAIVDRAVNFARSLINNYYLPDLIAIGNIYVKAGKVDGGGLAKTRVLAFGDYPQENYKGTSNDGGGYFENLLVRSNGVVEDFGKGLANAKFFELKAEDLKEDFAEGVQHAWYKYPDENDRHPWEGITDQNYTGPKTGTATEWQTLDESGKYSWLKTPKWKGKLCEVGPLAHYIIIYVKSQKGALPNPTWAEKMMLDQIAAVSGVLGVPAETWMPTMVGRTACRALDAQLAAEINKFFFDKLIANLKTGDTATMNNEKWYPDTWAKECHGVGLYEAPRGGLSHWVQIKDGVIDNYQCIVPTTWNACPRDDKEGHGAFELSMMDTHVADANKPLEIARVVRSFDPCMACATHMYNAKGEEVSVFSTAPHWR